MISRLLNLIRQRPLTVILALGYNASFVAGALFFSWGIEYIALLFWFEAAVVAVFELIAGFVLGPRSKDKHTKKADFTTLNVLFFILFQLGILYFALKWIVEYSGSSITELLSTIGPALLIPAAFLLASAIGRLIHIVKDRDSAIHSNYMVYRWFWMVFVPLQCVIVLVLMDSAAGILAILVLLAIVKFGTDLWTQITEPGKKDLELNTTHPGPHPFSSFNQIVRPIALYLAASVSFLAFGDSGGRPIQSEGDFIALVIIYIIFWLLIRNPNYSIELDESKKRIMVHKGRFIRRVIEIPFDDIEKISSLDTEQANGTGYLIHVKDRKKPLQIKGMYFSAIELFYFFRNLKTKHKMRVTNLKDPSKWGHLGEPGDG